MPSPLFPNFNRYTRQQLLALRQWAQAQADAQRRNGRGGNNQPEPRRYSRGSQNQQGAGQGNSGGNGGPGNNWLWNSVLRKLGPLGQLIDAILRPHGQSLAPTVQHELNAAQQLLESFGYQIGQPGGNTQVNPLLPELVNEALPPRPSRPTGNGLVSPTLPRRRSTVQPGNHRVNEPINQPATDSPEDFAAGITGPLVEGMIPVRSSNVHSIGYEWNPDDARAPGNLLVRFLGGTGKTRSGPGALYRYKDVPREVFTAFKLASSKGKFVWDELRVRGTISGHQYAYDLAGTDEAGYVPRQAGLKRGQKGEFYMQRSFKGRRSNLAEQQVRGSRQELTPNFRQKAHNNVKFRAGRNY